jgi:hypothetical protein
MKITDSCIEITPSELEELRRNGNSSLADLIENKIKRALEKDEPRTSSGLSPSRLSILGGV